MNADTDMGDDDLTVLPVIELAGSPRAMGEAFGETCREQTRELYDRRLTAAIEHARNHTGREFAREQVLRVAAACLPITEQYDPQGYDEFLGIARGAGLTPPELFIANGLTDLRDVMSYSQQAVVTHGLPEPEAEGCSAFVAAGDRTADGRMLIGQTWDLLTDNMPFVRLVKRRPDDGPATVSLTLTGCLTLIGLSSSGLAVGTTNLRTTDARIGLQYLSVLHKALNSLTFQQAIDVVVDAPRSAAHYYYLANRDGHAVGLACSATHCHRFDTRQGVFVHCNHALVPDIAKLEADERSLDASTSFRQQRLTELLMQADQPIDLGYIKTCLSDHEGGLMSICRHDHQPSRISTNAVVIMSPQTGELHACRGQAHVGQWVSVTI